MANYDEPTGSSGTVRMVITFTQNAANNTTTFTVRFQVVCTNSATHATGKSWNGNTAGTARSGTFSINGAQTVTVGGGPWTVAKTHGSDGLLAAQAFSFTMGATGTQGLGGPTTVTASITPPRIPKAPGAPPAPVFKSATANALTFTIAQPADNGGSAVLDYAMQVLTEDVQPGGADIVAEWSSGASSQTSPSVLSPLTTYRVRYRARNAVGLGSWSSQVFMATLAAPSAPGTPTISAITNTTATASWSPPSSTGGSPITGYDVQASQDATFATGVANGTSTSPTIGLTGLVPGRTYYVRVRARTAAGAGPYGGTASFTTTVPTTPDVAGRWFEHVAQVHNGSTWLDLPVISIRASEDMDRESYAAATLTLDWITDPALWALLDPRTQDGLHGPRVRWRIALWAYVDDVATLQGYLPGIGVSEAEKARHAVMWLRTVTRSWSSRTVTVELAGGESMLSDKRRISGSTINTGATTVSALVGWSLGDVFGGYALASDPIVTSTAIPAGDRRLMLQGESHIDLIKPELDAIGCRLSDLYGLGFTARTRDLVGALVDLSTTYLPEEGAPATALPIVTDATETLSRDGDWADGILVRYEPPGGTLTYQASGAGVNTRGRVVSRARAAPAGNAADQLVTRTKIRGRETDVVCLFRTTIRAATGLTLYSRDATLEGTIRAVEWDTAAATMTLRAQTGDAYD